MQSVWLKLRPRGRRFLIDADGLRINIYGGNQNRLPRADSFQAADEPVQRRSIGGRVPVRQPFRRRHRAHGQQIEVASGNLFDVFRVKQILEWMLPSKMAAHKAAVADERASHGEVRGSIAGLVSGGLYQPRQAANRQRSTRRFPRTGLIFVGTGPVAG